jgi:hypothetical protein
VVKLRGMIPILILLLRILPEIPPKNIPYWAGFKGVGLEAKI